MGNVALVTGGGRGIGLAIVRKLAERGYDIAINYRVSREAAETAAAELREQGRTTPILFLTARDEEFDLVRGLDAGGNDYVTKPFRIQELLSRIRVLLRKDFGPLARGSLLLDTQRMQVSRAGEILPLTLTEYRILLCLIRQRGVTTRDILLNALWDNDGKFVDDNTLSVHVSRLREKIGSDHIQTIRGVGYKWVD